MRVSNYGASKAFLSGEVARLCYKEIVGHAIAIAMSTGQMHRTKLSLNNFSDGLTITGPRTRAQICSLLYQNLVTDFATHHCPLLFSSHLSAGCFLIIAGIITGTPFRGYFVLSVGCCAPVSAIPASRVSSPSVTTPPIPPHQSICRIRAIVISVIIAIITIR